MEVLTPSAETFSVPSADDEEEESEMIINRRKKKTKKRPTLSKIGDDSSDDENKTEEPSETTKMDEELPEDAEKSPARRKRKSRIMDFGDSSSDEDDKNNEASKDVLHSVSATASKYAPISFEKDGRNGIDAIAGVGTSDVGDEKVPEEGKDNDSRCKEKSANSEDESAKSDNESAKSGGSDASDSADSSDDDAPPIRIFRSKNPSNVVGESRGIADLDDDMYDDEREDGFTVPDPSEVAEPTPSRARKPKRPSLAELQSETQRLVRESPINLPYHRPEPKRLSDFMKRPTMSQDKVNGSQSHKSKKEMNKNTSDGDEFVIDDLPDIGDHAKTLPTLDGLATPSKSEENCNDVEAVNSNNKTEEGNEVTQTTQPQTASSDSSQVTPARPLTRRERLLQRLGKNLPQLNTKRPEKSPAKFIDLDENAAKEQKSAGVTSLMQRFMKHSTAGKRRSLNKEEKIEFSIVRKQERADGSGVELVSEVVEATVGEAADKEQDEIRAVTNIETAGTPGQRLQLLRQRLAEKMKKRREIERKKREELYKLDNEEIDGAEAEEEEEEDCDWSDAESEEEEEEAGDDPPPKEDAKRGNGMIDDSDESESDAEDTEPFDEGKGNRSIHTTNPDSSLPRLVNEGSVMLFEESTRSSASTLNKSGVAEGRVTPALDRTCSDDSFYSSLIPLHQPEVSNMSSKHTVVSKRGEFDDTCFGSDSHSLSQPFKLDFEPSQSQFLDADGYIKESSGGKIGRKTESTLLPPGAEDDNAMTDCNMSQLLSLCSAPFETQKTQTTGLTQLMPKSSNAVSDTQELLGLCTGGFSDAKSQKPGISQLMDRTDSAVSNTQELIGLCTGNFTDSVLEDSKCEREEKDAEESLKDRCDVTKEDEDSGDLFRNSQSAIVDESFGFNILPGDPKKLSQQPMKFSDEENSDEDDEKPVFIVRKKAAKRLKLAKEFVENEAELSGSDVGSDDEDDGGPGEDEYEVEEPVEELPQEEEIARQVNRVHRRQMLEEDQRDIELLQEAFMGGEEIAQRERKFRWKNIDSSLTEDMFKSDEEDNQAGDDATQPVEDTQWMKERLEREEFLKKNANSEAASEDSQFLDLGRRVLMSRQSSTSATGIYDSDSRSKSMGLPCNGRLSIDESSCSRDSFGMKGRKGSFLRRSENVLTRLASLQELKNVNGPKHSDKMLFKCVSPKADKRKRKNHSEADTHTAKKEPPRKKTKVLNINDDSNSVFDLF